MMKETLKELVVTCVFKNIMFEGNLGANTYSVQDIVHTVGLRTIENLWRKHKKQLSALDSDSLFQNPRTTEKNRLQLMVDTLEQIFNYKRELEIQEAEKSKRKQESVEKLAILKNVKATKELEEMGKMSIEDIDKEIAELSKV